MAAHSRVLPAAPTGTRHAAAQPCAAAIHPSQEACTALDSLGACLVAARDTLGGKAAQQRGGMRRCSVLQDDQQHAEW